MSVKKIPSPWTTAIFSILLIVAVFLSALYAPIQWKYLAVIGFMVLFLLLLGVGVKGHVGGIFINERNMVTLSRFQMIIWTIIIISAFLTIAIERVYANVPDPLAIGVPQEVWELLGVSTVSLVGSPLILSTKVNKNPVPPNTRMTGEATRLNVNLSDTTDGLLVSRDSADKAEFSDMFRGDEKGNFAAIDMAKVQMFFFTLIAAFTYLFFLVNLIATKSPADLNSFPKVDPALVAILGISNAGYLANKTYDKTKSTRK